MVDDGVAAMIATEVASPGGQLIRLSLPTASLFWSPIGGQTKQSVGAD